MVVEEVKFFGPLLFFASNFQCEETPLLQKHGFYTTSIMFKMAIYSIFRIH